MSVETLKCLRKDLIDMSEKSDISYLSYKILKLSLELGVYWQDTLKRIEEIISSKKPNKVIINKLKKYYDKINPYA